jgi:hypothetical protein
MFCGSQFVNEVLMTKNGPIDFAQSWAVHENIQLDLWRREKGEVASHFWAHKMHVKELL